MKLKILFILIWLKIELYNTKIYEANEAYSSRLCSRCKFINTKDILETKTCKKCNLVIDRDINASKNIYHMNIHLLKS